MHSMYSQGHTEIKCHTLLSSSACICAAVYGTSYSNTRVHPALHLPLLASHLLVPGQCIAHDSRNVLPSLTHPPNFYSSFTVLYIPSLNHYMHEGGALEVTGSCMPFANVHAGRFTHCPRAVHDKGRNKKAKLTAATASAVPSIKMCGSSSILTCR